MGYAVYNLRGGSYGRKSSEADEFFEAAEKARKAVEKMHELACEMEDRYSERYFGDRYDRRDHDHWDDDDMRYEERRRRDSMGHYR